MFTMRRAKKKAGRARHKARACVVLAASSDARAHVVGKSANKERVLMNWADRLGSLTHVEFMRRYRLNKQKFAWLSSLLEANAPSSKFNPVKPERRVSQDLKLSMALRWLAGGDHKDIADMHGVHAHTTFYKYVRETVQSVNALPELKLMLMRQEGGLDLLTHPELLAPLIRDFDRRSGDVFTKCSMALDGVAIKLQCPRVNGAAYYCRKGFHSFNVQVICDSNHTILWCSILCVGSTHDSTAFAASRLAEALRDENHPFTKSSAWIAGDDAYSGCAAVMHNNMLTPYKGRNLDVWSDAFNFWQSSCRIVVECTLGELIARWGIMWRKLRMDIGFASEVIECCCRLHNVCVEQRDPILTGAKHSAIVHKGDVNFGRFTDLPELNLQLGGNDRRNPDAYVGAGARARRGAGPQSLRDELRSTLEAHQLARPKSSQFTYRSQSLGSRVRAASTTRPGVQ